MAENNKKKNSKKNDNEKNGSPASGKEAGTAIDNSWKTEEKAAKIKKNPAGSRLRDSISAVILIAFSVFMIIALLSDTTGQIGHMLSVALKGMLGLVAYILPFYLMIHAVLMLAQKVAHVNSRTVLFTLILILDIAMINSVRFQGIRSASFDLEFIKEAFNQGVVLDSAGAVGMVLGWVAYKLVAVPGLIITAVVILIICFLLVADTPISQFFDNLRINKNQKKIDKLTEKTESGTSDPSKDTMPLPKLPVMEEQDRPGSQSGHLNAAAFIKAGHFKFSDFLDGISRRKAEPETVIVSDKRQILDYMADDSLLSDAKPGDHNQKKSGSSDERELDLLYTDASGKRELDSSYTYTGEEYGLGSSDGEANIQKTGVEDSRKDRTVPRGLGPSYAEGTTEQSEIDSAGTHSSVERGLGPFYEDHSMDSYKQDSKAERGLGPSYGDSAVSIIGRKAEEKKHSLKETDFLSEGEVNVSDPDEEAFLNSMKRGAAEFAAAGEKIPSVSVDDPLTESFPAGSVVMDAKDKKKPVEKKTKKTVAQEAAVSLEALSKAAELSSVPSVHNYVLPPLALLNQPKRNIQTGQTTELQEKARLLEKVLQDFGVSARVINVNRGPSITRYEIQPATGVKVNSIVRLSDDIALNLRAKSLRIEAPIPGQAAIGIEVQNDHSDLVSIREMIESSAFREAKSKISFVVGEDITGNAVIADLKKMPHMLIAGSTGSGKSVCINSILMSMLYRSTPDEVKFILIDPKVVELGNYNGIPHMLIPVVTDPAKAAAALMWAVQEMEARYKKFAIEKVKNLEGFNNKMKKESRTEEVMPQIVIVIDELADLMIAAAKQVEESICRLAQLARAAGMHMIVATQRPSVDVVTGLIKANVPSRIAFAVSSQVDSRTILDRAGAEKLVGSGDMLFSPLGSSHPQRLQGPFVTDEEVAAVIDFWKEQTDGDQAPERMQQVMKQINTVKTDFGGSDSDDEDELYGKAVRLVIDSGQASASMLQRKFRIGYNRAGRLIDTMEARGIIGPSEGSRPRRVLVDKDEYDAGIDAENPEGSEEDWYVSTLEEEE